LRAEHLALGHVKRQIINRSDLPELLRQILDFDDIHKDWLFLLVPHPGPNSDSNENDGSNDPDDKIGCWEWPSLSTNFDECDNTCYDHNDGQC